MKIPPALSLSTPLLPSEPTGQRLCEIFGQYRWKAIEAELPEAATAKLKWQTISKYPIRPRVLWAKWQDAQTLIGVRFNHTTRYALIDIDSGSPHHSPEAVSRIRGLLETIGITRTMLVRSSWNGGLHLYIPLPEAVKTFDLAVAISECLKAQGYPILPGQLEVFPNVKSFGNQIFTEYNAHRLPLQPGSGSSLLNEALQPQPCNLERFFWIWDTCAQHQDLELLQEALVAGRECRKQRPRRKSQSVVAAWLADLDIEISEGWTDYGQTNRLLKAIACRSLVFEGHQGEALVERILELAQSSPGFATYCGHQVDLQRRARDWARAVERYYWPLGSQPHRQTSQNNAVPFNQQRQNAAQDRIQATYAELETLGELPAQVTARAIAISQRAGMSLQTLYKYKSLWHPDCQGTAQGSVMLEETSLSAVNAGISPEAPKRLEAPENQTLHTPEGNMKCKPSESSEASPNLDPFPPDGGVRGGELSFPQPATEEVLPVPFDEIFAGIQRQVQRLGWGIQQMQQFIAERFGGRRRNQLRDAELLTLLYHLQGQDSR